MPLLIGAMLLALPTTPPAWQGVWQGTVGHYPVQLCLEQRDYGDIGSYYYRSQGRPIALLTDARGQWRERDEQGHEGAVLRFTTAGADRLGGSWEDKGRKLPIALRRAARVADDDDERPCGSQAFHRPRLGEPVWQRSSARIGRLTYQRVRLVPGRAFRDVTAETFALDRKVPAFASINAAVAQQIATEDWFDCLRGAVAQVGTDGEYGNSYKPVALRGAFLSVRYEVSGSCGGAHPYWDSEPLTFDLRSGGSVELARWLAPTGMVPAKKPEDTPRYTLSPALERLLRARWPKGGDNCELDVFDYAFGWRIGLTSNGLGFTPSLPHVAQGCEQELRLSFAELAPFLSAEGKAGIAAMRAR